VPFVSNPKGKIIVDIILMLPILFNFKNEMFIETFYEGQSLMAKL
jgi:hypothetical protein